MDRSVSKALAVVSAWIWRGLEIHTKIIQLLVTLFDRLVFFFTLGSSPSAEKCPLINTVFYQTPFYTVYIDLLTATRVNRDFE